MWSELDYAESTQTLITGKKIVVWPCSTRTWKKPNVDMKFFSCGKFLMHRKIVRYIIRHPFSTTFYLQKGIFFIT